MQLNELLKTIYESDSSQWVIVDLNDRQPSSMRIVELSAREPGVYDVGTAREYFHRHRAVYAPDVDIVLDWGMKLVNEDEERDYDWSANFHDKKSLPAILLDVLYRGVLVNRSALVPVDGYRSFLPFPSTGTADGIEPGTEVEVSDFVHETKQSDVAMASLINSLQCWDDYTSRIPGLGWRIIEDL